VYLVIRHFMEVRRAPVWLKATTSGWVLGLFTLLLSFYFASL
jgi:cytochrome c oxidase subunit 4